MLHFSFLLSLSLITYIYHTPRERYKTLVSSFGTKKKIILFVRLPSYFSLPFELMLLRDGASCTMCFRRGWIESFLGDSTIGLRFCIFLITLSVLFLLVSLSEDVAGSPYDQESMAIIHLNNTTVMYLKEVTKFLALVCFLREESFERKGEHPNTNPLLLHGNNYYYYC